MLVILSEKVDNPMCFHRIPQLPFLYFKFVGLHVITNHVVFKGRNLKKIYNFPLCYLAHVIDLYDKCIQRKALLLICSSIRFIEQGSAFVWLQKCTFNYCTFFVNSNMRWTCSIINLVQQIKSKYSSCHIYSVYNIYIVQYWFTQIA